MAFSKHYLYPEEIQIISHFFLAYSYPGRLEVILKLKSEGPLCVAEILKGHPISRETMSGHLKILREAHLIIPEERFPYTFYHVHEQNLKNSEEALLRFFQLLKGNG
jgi:ArsR family transcriptional regulator